jgi:hypothetical protein
MAYGEYIVYADESGDHSLVSINEEFPVFVLVFCIFRVDDYVRFIVPATQRLKFDFFGHDMIVLHEREMRKALPPFDILQNGSVRSAFLGRVSSLVDDAPFDVIACVIDKKAFRDTRGHAANPYHVALEYGMERVFLHLQRRGQRDRPTCMVFESRGKAEDADLEREFERVRSSTRLRGLETTLTFRCAAKSANSTGLQIADMVARPIGLRVIRPGQANAAWDRIDPKIVRSPAGETRGWGLKVYP